MARPRSSVLLVVLGVLGAAFAGSYYFFVVYSREQDLAYARTQVAEWEVGWDVAWRCLVGAPPPVSSDLEGVLLAQSLLPVEAGRAEACGRVVGKLVRPAGNATAFDEVEAAWRRVEAAATALATSYLSFRQGGAGATAPASPLREMIHAWTDLRAAIGRPLKQPLLGAPLREAAVARLVYEGQPITEVVPSDAGASTAGRFSAAGRWSYGALARGGDVIEARAVPADPEVVVASPEPTWGVRALFDERTPGRMRLVAGARDASGTLAAPVELAAGASLVPAAALGAGSERAVVVAGVGALLIVRSSDEGKRWQAETSPWSSLAVFAHGDGVADVVGAPVATSEAAAPAVVWRRLTAASTAAPKVVTAPGKVLVTACPTAAGPWALLDEDGGRALLRLDDLERPATPAPTARAILACDERGVLVASEPRRMVMGCRDGACAPLLRWPAEGFGAVVGGEPTFVVVRDRHAVVLTKGAARPAKLPADLTPVSAHALDGSLLLLLRRPDSTLVGATLP